KRCARSISWTVACRRRNRKTAYADPATASDSSMPNERAAVCLSKFARHNSAWIGIQSLAASSSETRRPSRRVISEQCAMIAARCMRIAMALRVGGSRLSVGRLVVEIEAAAVIVVGSFASG
ncbi:MAG: hypothetical protein KDA33_17670, partial [Phycisphaerales bacterium]|nr:hypothetical protein [Phycisphaerales bacterium]